MFYPKHDSTSKADVRTAAVEESHLWKKYAALVSIFTVMTIMLFALVGCGGSNTSTTENSGAGSSTGSSESAPVLTVNDYTWDELSEISAEISQETSEEGAIEVAQKYGLVNSNGKLDGTQTKEIQLSDGRTATVQIAGFLHDDKTSGGKAGITFIFENAIAKRDMTSDEAYSGGWAGSQLRSWLASSGMSMLPEDLTSKIVAVDKKTNNAGKTESVASVTATSDKLWLFSFVELCGYAPDDVLAAEGSEYKLFRDCNVNLNNSLNSILIKNVSGSQYDWWERSPISGLLYAFYGVDVEGTPNHTYDRLSSLGVVPGFCI